MLEPEEQTQKMPISPPLDKAIYLLRSLPSAERIAGRKCFTKRSGTSKHSNQRGKQRWENQMSSGGGKQSVCAHWQLSLSLIFSVCLNLMRSRAWFNPLAAN